MKQVGPEPGGKGTIKRGRYTVPGQGAIALWGQKRGHGAPRRELRWGHRGGPSPQPLPWKDCVCGFTKTGVREHSAAGVAVWQEMSARVHGCVHTQVSQKGYVLYKSMCLSIYLSLSLCEQAQG